MWEEELEAPSGMREIVDQWWSQALDECFPTRLERELSSRGNVEAQHGIIIIE